MQKCMPDLSIGEGDTMNIRKNIDYSEMYCAIKEAMEQNMSQMELYCEIGKAVCARTEKGAAVAAAEYLRARYPDVRGFSPRNLRRMRDFYRMYENEPNLLALAMEMNWTQNVVILEADLTMEEREWYLKAACRFGWSKIELIEKILSEAHLKTVLDIGQNMCYNNQQESNIKANRNISNHIIRWARQQYFGVRRFTGSVCRLVQWYISCYGLAPPKHIVFLRC